MLNYMTRQRSLKERMIEWRREIEGRRQGKGLDLLPWKLLQETKGNVRKGPTFHPELLPWDNTPVDIIGFMVPIETFRNMSEFLLLPMPIECYFCERPPMRDVMLVRMKEGETADLFREPIIINGILHLSHGPETKFFYVTKNTTFGPGEEEGLLTRKGIAPEHMGHYEAARLAEELAKEGLLDGKEPPRAEEAEIVTGPPLLDEARLNAVRGEQFLEENAQKEGIVVLHSGLQYKVVREGVGRTPKLTDKVKTHYRGTFIDGTEFDSSYSRNQPAVFGVDKVIHGWTEALQLMQEGAKWRLFIPPELAYGEPGFGKTIPPNATLIFEIELLDVLDGQ